MQRETYHAAIRMYDNPELAQKIWCEAWEDRCKLTHPEEAENIFITSTSSDELDVRLHMLFRQRNSVFAPYPIKEKEDLDAEGFYSYCRKKLDRVR